MRYISSREAAEKWGVSLCNVQRLLRENRIPGAEKHSNGWLIPADAQKPMDPRKAKKAGMVRHGTYAVLPVLYIHGGDLDGAYARCASEEERTLLHANLAYFRGEAKEARALAAGLYQTTAEPQLKLGCEVMRGLAAMSLGDAQAWKETVLRLSALRMPEELEREREFAIAALNAGLHGRQSYPKWLETGAFTGLSPALFPAARWVYASILYIKWKEVDLLAVAEPFIAECRREQSDLCEIYLRLIAATGYLDHGNKEQARLHIREAAALAMPLGFLSPFIEYRHILPGVMDACLKPAYPEALAIIKRRARPAMDAWAAVYNSVWDKPIAGELTPREFEACLLYSRGMAAREIALRVGVSINSVKKYMGAAYDKLGVKNKEQLKAYIHP